MAILICKSEVYYLRNWLLTFIVLQGIKLYAQFQVYNAVRDNEMYLTGVSLRIRLIAFGVDNGCFIWFLYGNVLYYYYETRDDMGFIFTSLFFSILIYGYTFMLKFAIECIVVCCAAPIRSFLDYLYPTIEPTTKLSKVILLF